MGPRVQTQTHEFSLVLGRVWVFLRPAGPNLNPNPKVFICLGPGLGPIFLSGLGLGPVGPDPTQTQPIVIPNQDVLTRFGLYIYLKALIYIKKIKSNVDPPKPGLFPSLGEA